MDLLRHAKSIGGDKACNFIKDYFENLGLPITQETQYLPSHGHDAHIFLDKYACDIRLTEIPLNRTKTYDFESQIPPSQFTTHPHQLQPIATKKQQFADSIIRIDIFPGIILNAKNIDISWIDNYHHKEILGKIHDKGLSTLDPNPTNIGVLPAVTPHFPLGYPVILDPGGICNAEDVDKKCFHLNKAQKVIAHLNSLFNTSSKSHTHNFLHLTNDQNPQKALYGPLVDCFQEAWPQEQPKANAEKMKSFWKMMENYKERGILICGWNESKRLAIANAAINRQNLSNGSYDSNEPT